MSKKKKKKKDKKKFTLDKPKKLRVFLKRKHYEEEDITAIENIRVLKKMHPYVKIKGETIKIKMKEFDKFSIRVGGIKQVFRPTSVLIRNSNITLTDGSGNEYFVDIETEYHVDRCVEATLGLDSKEDPVLTLRKRRLRDGEYQLQKEMELW